MPSRKSRLRHERCTGRPRVHFESNQSNAARFRHAVLLTNSNTRFSYQSFSATPLWHAMIAVSFIMYSGTYYARTCKYFFQLIFRSQICVPIGDIHAVFALPLFLIL